MTQGNTRRVSPGETFRPAASDWNRFLEAATEYERNKFNGGAPAGVRVVDPNRLRVRNDTGAARDRFDVVEIGAPVITPATNLDEFLTNPTATATTPGDSARGRWGILAEAIPDTRYGKAIVAGVCPARIRVLDAAHEYVDAIPDGVSSIHLATDYHGSARILWRESGTGPKWALIRLGVRDDEGRGFKFTLLGSLSGGSALAELTDFDDVAHDTATIFDPIGAFAELDTGATGLARFESGRYWVWQAACE
jgi:hypothetical protein